MFNRFMFICLCMLMFASCLHKDNPYANFTVGEVDEKTSETTAAILVGKPQVFTRETLINDRAREVNHIRQLIEESRYVVFEPQILRDISVVSSMVAQLGITFNPAIGDAFKRKEDIEKIKDETELLKLRNKLSELKKLVESDPGSSELVPTQKEPGTLTDIGEPSTTEIKKQLADLIAAANNSIDKLVKLSKIARESKIKASPEDHFEDLNSYRARLRHRESEVRLDDGHDANGNTLYRLQFNATVLPGSKKNKYGILDFEIHPPNVVDTDLDKLYEYWLADMMLQGVSPAINHRVWEQVQTTLLNKNLINRILLSYNDPLNKKKKLELILFTNPKDDEILTKIFYYDHPSVSGGVKMS